MSPMREGFLGTDLAVANLSTGSNLVYVGHKSPDPFVLTVNLENGPGGDLQLRPDYDMEYLFDPDTSAPLAEEIIRAGLYPRLRSAPIHIIVTATRVFEYRPRQATTWNAVTQTWDGGGYLRKLHTWATPITTVDMCEWNGYFYLATGKNYLQEWDGSGAFTDISDGWDEGYQKPSCICSYSSLLIAGGFQDTASAVQTSEIRATDVDDASTLLPYSTLLRSLDNDEVTALCPAPWGLMVFKRNNTFRITGSDFQEFTDVDQRLHTPGFGCVGPMAWCLGTRGDVFFMSREGVHVAVNPVDAAREISGKVSPIWGHRPPMTAFAFPRASSDLERAVLSYNPGTDQLIVDIPGVAV